MRLSSLSLGAVLALSGTVYGSYGSNMVIGRAMGGLFQRRSESNQQNDSAGAVLEGRQAAAGRCGADQGNAKCPSDQCCSQWGYCGVGNEFCNTIALCQTAFGSCLGAGQSATAAPPASSSASAAPPPPVSTTSAAAPPPASSSAAPVPTSTSVSTVAPQPPSSTSAAPPPPASTSARPPPPPPPAGGYKPSTDGTCGNTTTCAGSGHGSCCSEFYYCGDGIEYCGTGCQSAFGLCFSGAAAPPPPVVTGTLTPSTSGACGNTTTCAGSTHGSCCSQFYHCGDGTDYCAAGCQSSFGLCFGGVAAAPPPAPASSSRAAGSSAAAPASSSSPAASSSAAAAAPASSASASASAASSASAAAPSGSALPAGVSVTTDGSCGNGKTCTGSTFGQCCSQFGFCGDGEQFCPFLVSCQPEWGHCDPAPSGTTVS
ncbi:carbohydrate-binding module family 18 protein [Niveomyces insectorum RCEF 264]|uniref:Carbohydrate-binding module family 18 protein n=1 Tax=Niveomyces insectorum RCEF 264 TaxID=1081102 RepID=A0A167VKR0_9HYPO|nr:carbohydrate-binding module family 18 protein [Niveomyces insectorum RCEF 264]